MNPGLRALFGSTDCPAVNRHLATQTLHPAFAKSRSVDGDELRIEISGEKLAWSIADLHDDWFNAIRSAVEGEAERIPSL